MSSSPGRGADEEAVLRARLKAAGLRSTGPRLAVLAVLADRGGHLSAEDVVARVADDAAGVHRASVYRTLEALSDAGIVQHVHLGHGATTYHLADEVGEHLHLQCGSCGAVIDAPAAVVGTLRRRLLQDHGFDLDATHVALSGTCGACRQDAASR